ncbi:bleomycin resistance protein [Aquicoccus sp. G2-2]|uniref:bleomycin resistance protein n=1 Tax=Aquicoccus sp. G2-2 TaxID=3092120 RepID=UPI002AE063CB|nr:bleomycin resistance protein [Aquicoccus sp. G2-2]MEA1112656.1 bleomycin resistance protein [Aquicoccus sp. G2-2]
MSADRITANLPSRDFAATIAFYARLGFTVGYHGADWLILIRGPLELEFFPHPDLAAETSAFSACIRVDDLDSLHSDWQSLGLPADLPHIPRLTECFELPGAPRMFALIDNDGSLLRCLENGD